MLTNMDALLVTFTSKCAERFERSYPSLVDSMPLSYCVPCHTIPKFPFMHFDIALAQFPLKHGS